MERPPTALATSRIPLGRAHLLASTAIRETRRAGLPLKALTPLGSLRRYAPDIGDVSLLGIADLSHHADILTAFGRLPFVWRVESQSSLTIAVLTDRGSVTLHLAPPEHAGAALVWHTGSRHHTLKLQDRAAHLGFRFRDGILRNKSSAAIPARDEEELYGHLGLPYIAPELREGNEELEAAERGELPDLVTDLHVRGDLHMHTTWSDGRNTVEEMVAGCRRLGYQYMAITDHSERSWASRKLRGEDISKQRAEITSLRERFPDIVILHGIEVDIMHDGSLDFDDAQLEGFDIVLASLHDHGGHASERLTERYLDAIRHPLVNIITHPANRSPGQSAGYDVDFDRLFAAAAATGTAMEIDGAPGHLDLDGVLARRAVAAGVTIAVDSDCHRVEALPRQMRFGIGTARRGWIEPRNVLNARGIEAIREFVAHKRATR